MSTIKIYSNLPETDFTGRCNASLSSWCSPVLAAHTWFLKWFSRGASVELIDAADKIPSWEQSSPAMRKGKWQSGWSTGMSMIKLEIFTVKWEAEPPSAFQPFGVSMVPQDQLSSVKTCMIYRNKLCTVKPRSVQPYYVLFTSVSEKCFVVELLTGFTSCLILNYFDC